MTQRHEDSDDDTFVKLGSAFEKLETVEDVEKAKRKKDKEHYVTDDKGRRRFHGAFTGGFSAGYFNTVGSEEGWTPSNFVSSKEKKSTFSSRRAEFYMDDEDLGEHGIAPRGISAKEKFDQKVENSAEGGGGGGGVIGQKRELESSLRSVIPGAPALQNLVMPARSTVGAELLRAMGWKEGQGVGPKTARPIPKQGGKKVYGCSLPGDAAEDSSYAREAEAEGFLFAPSDTASWEVSGKDDVHGIGYRGIQDQLILGSRKATKSLYGMSGEAFGLGALEDEEGDEDNVYGVETLTSYDSSLANEGEISMERKFGWTGTLQTGEWNLSSFKRASKQTTNTRKYPPPDVPRSFVCQHVFGTSTLAAPPTNSSTAGHMPTNQKPFSSTERAQILAEKPNSIFNLLSEKDREKLKGVSERVKSGEDLQAFLSTTTTTNNNSTTNTTSQQPPRPPASAPPPAGKPALGRQEPVQVKPFSNDPAKMARYEAYLAGKAPPSSGVHMTEWERQKEAEEFSRAAKVFTPLTSALSSKFTRGEELRLKDKEKQPERPLTPESDAVQAAKASMFGVMTRQTQDWHPHRLICKRFNIPDPYPNSSVVGVASERQRNDRLHGKGSRNLDFVHTERIVPVETAPQLEGQSPSTRPPAAAGTRDTRPPAAAGTRDHVTSRVVPPPVPPPVTRDVKPSSENTEEGPTDAEETKERPPMDLFKAIFAESSSEDDSSSDVEENNEGSAGSKTDGNISSVVPKKWQDLSVITSTALPAKATVNNPAPSSGRSDSQRRESKDHHAILPTPAQRVNENATRDVDKRDRDNIHEKGSEYHHHHHNSSRHSSRDTRHQHSSDSHYHSNNTRSHGSDTGRHGDNTHRRMSGQDRRRRDHEAQSQSQHRNQQERRVSTEEERDTAGISRREEAPSAPPVSDAPAQQVSYGPALPLDLFPPPVTIESSTIERGIIESSTKKLKQSDDINNGANGREDNEEEEGDFPKEGKKRKHHHHHKEHRHKEKKKHKSHKDKKYRTSE